MGRVIRASLSPDREQLLLIDERDGLLLSLADERVSLSVEPLPGMQLSQVRLDQEHPPSILAMHVTARRGEPLNVASTRSRAPLDSSRE